MRIMVVKGRAWVEWWIQATVLTKLQIMKKGRAKRELVRMTFHTQLWPPIFLKKLADTKPEMQEVRAYSNIPAEFIAWCLERKNNPHTHIHIMLKELHTYLWTLNIPNSAITMIETDRARNWLPLPVGKQNDTCILYYTCTSTTDTCPITTYAYQVQHWVWTCEQEIWTHPCWWSSNHSHPGLVHLPHHQRGCSGQNHYVKLEANVIGKKREWENVIVGKLCVGINRFFYQDEHDKAKEKTN